MKDYNFDELKRHINQYTDSSKFRFIISKDHNGMDNLSTIVQQPLSGSDAEASSPKVATQPSDNGERCTQ